MTSYADKLLAKLESKSTLLTGKWECSDYVFPVEVVSDNGRGKLLIKFASGNVTEASKEWFLGKFTKI